MRASTESDAAPGEDWKTLEPGSRDQKRARANAQPIGPSVVDATLPSVTKIAKLYPTRPAPDYSPPAADEIRRARAAAALFGPRQPAKVLEFALPSARESREPLSRYGRAGRGS